MTWRSTRYSDQQWEPKTVVHTTTIQYWTSSPTKPSWYLITLWYTWRSYSTCRKLGLFSDDRQLPPHEWAGLAVMPNLDEQKMILFPDANRDSLCVYCCKLLPEPATFLQNTISQCTKRYIMHCTTLSGAEFSIDFHSPRVPSSYSRSNGDGRQFYSDVVLSHLSNQTIWVTQRTQLLITCLSTFQRKEYNGRFIQDIHLDNRRITSLCRHIIESPSSLTVLLQNPHLSNCATSHSQASMSIAVRRCDKVKKTLWTANTRPKKRIRASENWQKGDPSRFSSGYVCLPSDRFPVGYCWRVVKSSCDHGRLLESMDFVARI